jgi:hypothetical protein
LVIGVVSDTKVEAVGKQHKSFNINTSTRNVSSTFIHSGICDTFNVATTEKNEFTITSVEGLDGAFVLSHLGLAQDTTTDVEVKFDKGEDVVITQA